VLRERQKKEMAGAAVAKKPKICNSAVSRAVIGEEKIVTDRQLKLWEPWKTQKQSRFQI
jgi:hypothetical protein